MKTLAIWTVIAALLTAMALAGGCALDEIVTVDVPPNTRTHFRETLDTNVPPTVTLRDARILRSEGDRRIEQRRPRPSDRRRRIHRVPARLGHQHRHRNRPARPGRRPGRGDPHHAARGRRHVAGPPPRRQQAPA